MIRALHSCGAIALHGDSSGRIFIGSWAGLAGERITDNFCVWIKMERRVSSQRKRAEFMARVKAEVSSLVSDRYWLDVPLRYGKGVIGKMSLCKSGIVHLNRVKQPFFPVLPLGENENTPPHSEKEVQRPDPSEADDHAPDM
jgi:hypothetical protein